MQEAKDVNRKVKAAFQALEERGDWLCRMFFSCCGSCAAYELSGVAKETGRMKAAFFSRQARENMKSGNTLYVNYGWDEGTNEQNAAVGRELKEALEAQGLRVEWDGDPRRTVEVPID